MTFSSGIERLRLSALGDVRSQKKLCINFAVVVVAQRGCAHAMRAIFARHIGKSNEN